jgi:Flp pilus assembly protein TadG
MRRFGQAEEGQTTVELALCLPVVVFVVVAVIEIGLIVGDQIRLWHAAREAARQAVVDDDTDAAVEAAERAGFDSLDVTIEPDPHFRRQGEPLEVTLVYDRPGAMPLVGRLFEHVELESTATMRIERP